MKLVSIIIPIYNNESTVGKAIESSINQIIEEIEVILINDGSSDNSLKILKEYELKYPDKIKVYNKENTGIADTRNFGIERAEGKYIMFLDADDYIDINLLENLKQYIDRDIELIKYKMKIIEESEQKETATVNFDCISGEEGFNKLCFTDVFMDSPCLYLMHKSIFTKNNLKFTKNTYHEDFGLMPFVLLNAKTMVSTDIYGYNYIQSDNSIMRNNDYKKTLKKADDLLIHYDNMITRVQNMQLNYKTVQNLKIYYTNNILLKLYELKNKDQKRYIKEIRKRKMQNNIKVRNIKQFMKKIILNINIKLYLKIR